tara:strand:- start:325 stop:975 length:651 start_codon:yes stop_codon:yes gene_type:complete
MLAATLITFGSLAGGANAATIIATDNFDGLTYTTETGWNGSGPATTGQWSVAATGGLGSGRTAVDNDSLGYTGVPTPQSGTGYGQFSNGFRSAWVGTISDTAGHVFGVGDKVSIDFFAAQRTGSGELAFTIALIGADTLNFAGSFAPTSTSYDAFNTGEVTITTAGSYNVVFTSVAQANDRTSFIDSVSYSVAVPEPSSTALLGLGGLALMLRRRR